MAAVSEITGYTSYGPFSNFGGYAGTSSTNSGVGGVGAYHHHHQSQAGQVQQPGNDSAPATNQPSDVLNLLDTSPQTSSTAQAGLYGNAGQFLDLLA